MGRMAYLPTGDETGPTNVPGVQPGRDETACRSGVFIGKCWWPNIVVRLVLNTLDESPP
jgi:hypothetical protein